MCIEHSGVLLRGTSLQESAGKHRVFRAGFHEAEPGIAWRTMVQ